MHPSPSAIMKTAICLGLMLFGAPVLLANPAVSEINGKIGVMHGSMDSESTTSLEGSITWPVLESFGIQLDGLYSTMQRQAYGFAQVDDADLGGVGGHFFWRDSETFMLGVEAGYVFGDPVDSWELGLEAEFYYKWLTIGGKAGVASISYDQQGASFETDKDAFFCQLYLGAYPVDNLLVAAFVENRFDNTYFSIEVEYELPVPGLSMFANAMKGDHGYDHAFVGMRYYFGEDKPLKNRHRENDPRNTLTGIRHGIGTWQAEIHEQVVKSANQVPMESGGSGSIGGGSIYTGGSISTGGGTISIGGGSISIGGSGIIGIGGQLGGGTVIGPGSGLSSGGSLSTGGSLVISGGGTVIGPGSGLSSGGSLSTGGSLVISGGGTVIGPGSGPGSAPLILGGTLTNGTLTTVGGTLILGTNTQISGVSGSFATSNPSTAINWLLSIPPPPEPSNRMTTISLSTP